MNNSDTIDERSMRIGVSLKYHDEYESLIKQGVTFEEASDFLIEYHKGDVPYVNKGKIDCTALAKYFKEHEHYYFVAGKLDSSKAIRYLYNASRGVYEVVSDIAFQSKIKEYIEKATPDNVKSRDIQETFYLITRDQCFIHADKMNESESFINFTNGILNIDDGAFFPHTPDILSSIQINAHYDPEKSYTLDDAPTFKSYIETLTAGDEADKKKALLLEYLGACISNVAGSRFKKCLFLKGKGDSGKSQFLQLICRILGTDNVQAVDFSSLSDRFAAASYYDKRFIFTGDAEFDVKKSNKRFMEITGGDPITVEQKGMTGFTASCKGMMLFSSNYLPTWSGNKSAAAYNRILVVVCDNSIPIEKQDKNLIDKLIEERNAIVYLALQSLKAAISRGYRLTITNESQRELAKLQKNNQHEIAFFSECCTRDIQNGRIPRIRTTRLHEAYKLWFSENYPSSNCVTRGFGAEIAQYLGISENDISVKSNGFTYYLFDLTREAKERFHSFDSIAMNATDDAIA